eukprot:m.266731 g.266731  ORF g.266731 m.266731 type:complete len:147 (+) comp69020_c0_seq1:234-674(+)
MAMFAWYMHVSCLTFALIVVYVTAMSSSSTTTPNKTTPTRHVAWWRPVGCGNSSSACQNETLTSLSARYGAWDTFSPTVARVYNGTTSIDLDPFSSDVDEAIQHAQKLGYRIVPILEIDCGKVIGNATSLAQFEPAINALGEIVDF